MEAAKLADDYHLARKGRDGDIKHNGKAPMKPGIKCLKCGKIGHIARECRGTSLRPEIKTNGEGKRNKRTRKELKDVECFNCRKKGHYSSNCPDRSLLCMEGRVDQLGEVRTRSRRSGENHWESSSAGLLRDTKWMTYSSTLDAPGR